MAYYRFNCHAQIGQYAFRSLVSAKIESSWRTLNDRARIALPGLSQQLEKVIKEGDSITIQLGYNDQLTTRFVGFVTKIKPGVPYAIEAEDAMYDLKRDTISKAYRSVTMADLIHELVTGADVANAPALTLSPFRLDQVSTAKALDTLRETYGLAVYYRDGRLFAGLPYTEQVGDTAIIDLLENVPRGGADRLVFEDGDGLKIKVKAVGVNADGSKVIKEIGDKDGEVRTLHFYNKSESELAQLASDKLALLKQSGYSGSLTLFGEPAVRHGQVVEIRDQARPERSGRYFVDSVTDEVSKQSGYRQIIELGKTAL